MIQSHIVLTETTLDSSKINAAIAWHIFKNIDQKNPNSTNFNQIINSFCRLEEILESEMDLEKNWQHLVATNQILEANFKDKEDFTDSILEYYKSYNQPTFLFLGDLSSYSLLLQEGMLRLLEEPPANLQIILLAGNKAEILPTILSRSQSYKLSRKLVLTNLDQKLLEKVKKKLPQVSEFTKNFVQNKPFELPDLKTVEREEISFWLWQVLCYLEEYYKHQASDIFAAKIEQLLTALSLNSQNLQKKFVLGWLK